jgi:myxalamid-type polyketide synthase MxaB
MRLPAGPHESRDYVLYPGLIDSCFQVMAAALPDEGMGSTVYLPLGIGAFRVFGAMPARLWCRARVTEPFAPGSETCTGSLQLLDESGGIVAEIESLAVKRAPREVLLRSIRRPGEDWLYRLDWEPAPRADAGLERDLAGTWAIVADGTGVGEELADLIRRYGGEVTAGYSPGVRGVVHLASLDPDDLAGSLGCERILRLVQAIAGARLERPPQLWIVTRQAQAMAGDTDPVRLSGAPLWGLGRVIAAEHPELRPCMIDLDGAGDATLAAAQVFEEITRPDAEDQIALRGGQRFAARLARVTESESAGDGPVQLDISARGTLENLQYRATTRRAPGPHEIEIRVHATGLNFRDVLNALGMYPGNPGPFGGECSGVVSAVGERVKDFAPGDEVTAIAPGSFGSFVTTPAELAVAKPGGMPFEEAAAIPMAYLTAEYALHRLGGMTSADRVLIHAAAGGVGMAAVRLAQSCGAEIFATAGSEAKREFLRSLGVHHVMDSRSVTFASEILALTGGRGVDLVLNSLAGEFIPKSLEALARGGRFLEIGKREIWPDARMRAARPDVTYHTIALDRMMIEEPEGLGEIFRGIMKRIGAGSLQTMPVRAFPASEVQAAFRHMALARHIGKVVVSQAPAQIRGDGTYLITGGLGALGLRVAEWMAARGARHIVLAGRGEPSEAARERIQEMGKGGAKVVTVRVDVTSHEGMSAVFEQLEASLPPLRGIVHAAGVLDDGILLRQDWARFQQVLAPKIAGAWNLHRLSQNLPLDFFVLFSSGASLLGSPGQGNYAAANAFLDALAHWRRARGQTALSINWGPWSDQGMGARIQSKVMGSIPPDTGVEILERLLAGAAPQVAVLPLNLGYLGKHLGGHRAGLFANLLREEQAGPAAPAASSDFGKRLHAAAPEDRAAMIAQHVREEVMKVLGLDPAHQFDARQSFFEIGMDSLMAVEVRNRLQATLGVYLPSTLVFDYPAAESMTAYLLKQTAPAVAEPADEREAELESLSEDQLEELLLQKLESLQARSGQ